MFYLDFDNKALDKYLVEVKRIEESRSKGADKEIRSLYKSLLKKLNSFIGEYYTKYSDDNGVLNVAILQQNAKYASFLEEVDKNIKEVTPAISKTIKSTVEKTYKACFEGMINGFSNSAGDIKFKDSFNGLSIKPEVLKAAVENPISGLTLPERLQKHRQDVIYDIRQSISNSLMTGERFDTTSKKLVERLDVSYGKASRIVRTESHRVQEKGLMDGAEHINDKVKGDGLVYAAIWHNLGDEKVRPNIRVKTKKGWKTYKSHTNANHRKMEGQLIESGGYFDLGNGVKAKSPGESGDASNDCNCRCFVEYEMMTVEEFEERGGKWKNSVKKYSESGISGKKKLSNYNNKVDLEYINSNEYRAKFDRITEDKNVNRSLYKYSKAILTHRNGSDKEDLYLIDSKTGKLFDALVTETADFGVSYTEKFTKKLKEFPRDRLISIHNHPTNNPPTGSDFGSVGYNGYKFGIVVCHSGEVYKYNVGSVPFTSNLFDKLVDNYRNKGYTEKESIVESLKYFEKKYGINWSEI